MYKSIGAKDIRSILPCPLFSVFWKMVSSYSTFKFVGIILALCSSAVGTPAAGRSLTTTTHACKITLTALLRVLSDFMQALPRRAAVTLWVLSMYFAMQISNEFLFQACM